MGIKNFLEHGLNMFSYRNKQVITPTSIASTSRPIDTLNKRHVKTLANTVITKLAVDCSLVDLRHVKREDGLYKEDIKDELHYLFSMRANVDQTSRFFMQDFYQKLLDNGVCAIAITEYEDNLGTIPKAMRCGRVVNWFVNEVELELYNDLTGNKDNIILPKEKVFIVQNPFFSIMNDRNSTGERLSKKLALLDKIDAAAGSGNFDIIVQLPYATKGKIRKEQAQERINEITTQLKTNEYGIAYIDAAEHVIQLNRPSQNNLLAEIEYLTQEYLSQLGIPIAVFNGTATEEQMKQYYERVIVPIVENTCEEITTKAIGKAETLEGEAIWFYYNPFKLCTLATLSEAADTFTRNEILTGNEYRNILGFKASSDPRANKLQNKNLNPTEFEGKNPDKDVKE